MKILQLIPQFILPAIDGGKIGILNITKEFSKENDLILILFSNFKPEEKYIKELEKYGEVHLIIIDISNSNMNILKSIIRNRPVYLNKFYNQFILKQIDNFLINKDYDIIHSDHTSMAQIGYYLHKKYFKPFSIRLHNLEHIIWQRYSEDLKLYDFKKYLVKYQSQLLKKEELNLINKASISFPITENDNKLVKKYLPNSKTIVSSAGVDLELNKSIDIEKDKFTLCIATTYNWIHNVNGLIWFVEKVLPLIRNEIPDVKLKLYGKNIPSLFNDLKKDGVEPVGFVDDISTELSKANIYIAPLFVGSGIRIKILEAMAHSLPVVATNISAEGIIITKDNGLFVSDNAFEQANYIIKLLNNSSEAIDIGLKARKFIEENYSWSKNVEVILNEYHRLVQ